MIAGLAWASGRMENTPIFITALPWYNVRPAAHTAHLVSENKRTDRTTAVRRCLHLLDGEGGLLSCGRSGYAHWRRRAARRPEFT